MANELSLAECQALVDQLSALRVFEINFGGGEPLLKEYFFSLLDYIHTKGIVTCISTNGTLLTEKIVSNLVSNTLVHIQISLDGATPEINDCIRGRDTFYRALKGVELLAAYKIPFSINTVVTSINYSQLGLLKNLATSYGAALRVSRFRPSGRAQDSWDKLKLNTSQLEELSEWLNKNPNILTGDSFFSITGKGGKELGLDMCGACKMTCCIDPVGSIYPCAFLQENEFYAGNIRETSFKNIWDSSPVFYRFRNLEPASCKRCSRFENCRGGCPAVAYFVRRDLESADPECLASWERSKYGRTI
jgi:mycofactocin biosynthetic radical S-adenosylmethionine protein MftC